MSERNDPRNGRTQDLPASTTTILMRRAQEVAARIEEYPISLESGLAAHIEVVGVPEAGKTVVVIVCRSQDALPSAAEIQRAYPLTPRETEVALLMALGHSDKRIARELKVKTACASRHAERVRAKMGIYSRRHVRGMLTAIHRVGDHKKAS